MQFFSLSVFEVHPRGHVKEHSVPFLWPYNTPPCGQTTLCFSFPQLLDIWVVSTFRWWWIMLLWTFAYKVFSGWTFYFCRVPGVGSLGHLVTRELPVWRTPRLCSRAFRRFTFPAAVPKGPVSPHPHPHSLSFCLSAVLMGAEWGISLWFGFVFPGWPSPCVTLNIFPCVCWPFVHLPWRRSIRILCPFLKWVVCLLNFELCAFHVLDKNSSSDN